MTKPKINIKELNSELVKRQIKCLSTKYLGSDEKHEFLCLTCQYRWFSRYNSVINRESGCPNCSYENLFLKISIFELNKKLFGRNIRCLNLEYLGSLEKHKWQCLVCENTWFATYSSIIDAETGCPKCAVIRVGEKRRLKLTIEEINKKLQKRDIICLSDEYVGVDYKYQWKCLICNYEWKATYDSVVNKRKSGCLKCKIVNRSDKNHYRWRGGYSRKDYPSEWNEKLRKFIRNRDNHKCQYPDCQYDDTREKKKLDVHHIDGNKQNCENWNLISLCCSHHIKIEHNSQIWIDYFYAITDSFEL